MSYTNDPIWKENMTRMTERARDAELLAESAKLDEKYAQADASDARCEAESLRSDCLTLAMRLYSEDPDTFAPETREVMDRWRVECDKVFLGEA